MTAVLDDEPLLPPPALGLLEWAASYYHHPVGEVIFGALPGPLRQGRAATAPGLRRWLPAPAAATGPLLDRAPRQAALLDLLRHHPQGLGADALSAHTPGWERPMRVLVDKGLAQVVERPCLDTEPQEPTAPLALGRGQRDAVDTVCAAQGGFETYLLEGVTGSGKTEVYLQTIARLTAQGRQALVLIPEIALTPQMVARFRRRFRFPVAVLHSGLSDGERLCAWLMARNGTAPVVIGTRSAVFVPLKKPGVIIVDEEHDLSYKQQEGFRYSARDLAVVRGQRERVPVLLGSATPSLESLNNMQQGRYRHLALPERAAGTAHPVLRVLDVKARPLHNGLSDALLAAVAVCLGRDEQVLLFLNRRGFAPSVLCHDCGWVAGCGRCDAHMTLHRPSGRLRCHHCGSERALPEHCPECGGGELRPLGSGTQRLEQALADIFPSARLARIDRDSTRRKGALATALRDVTAGRTNLLVGTQMLAKGHHFPNLTLVAIVDADGGLFSADFRASERMAQLVVQVAGRAGRGEQPGEVLIQTHHPEHPLLRALIEHGYASFARAALAERQAAGLPPYQFMALMRAEAPRRDGAMAFLEQARTVAPTADPGGVELLGPVPAPMERRAGRYRAHLLLQCPSRPHLHKLLDAWIPAVEVLKATRNVRWSVDVDPQEMD